MSIAGGRSTSHRRGVTGRLRLLLPVVLLGAACGRTDAPPAPDSGLDGWERIASFEVEDGTISAAQRLSSGRILVRGSPNVLALYDSMGTRLADVGRRGRGPGEYSQLDFAAESGRDSIWAFDLNGQRLSLFDGDGDFVDSWPVRMSFGSLRGRFSDGAFLFTDPMMPMPPKFVRLGVVPVDLLTLRLPASTPQVVLSIPMWTMYVDPAGTVTLAGQPHGPEGVFAAADSTLWTGFGDTPVIVERDRTGRELRRVEVPIVPIPFTSADRDEYLAQPEARGFAHMAKLRPSVPLPTHRTYFTRMLHDAGTIWLELRRSTDSTASRWVRAVPAAGTGDTLELPPGHHLLQLASPWLVLRVSERGGDEYVQVFRRRARP